MKSILTLVLVVLLTPCFGQDYTIKFDQVMESSDSITQSAIDMIGETSMIWYISGEKFRIGTSMGMAGKTDIIFDGGSKKMLMLMENPFMGNTYSVIHDTLDAPEPEIMVTKTKETMKIAGYKCVKYIIKGEAGESIVYATSKIPAPSKSEYNGKVEGVVLCTIATIDAMGAKIKSTQTATEVIKGKIDAELFSFDIPEGYNKFDANAFEE